VWSQCRLHFDVAGCSTTALAQPSISLPAGCMAYGTMNTRTVRDRLEILVQSVTTGSVVTAYGLDEVTEFG
jgi:hypothetical protein